MSRRRPGSFAGAEALAAGQPSSRDAGPLFDRAPKKRSGFEAGMESSEASAASAWSPADRALVDAAIRALAQNGTPFTSEDVWKAVPAVPVTKGLSSRLNAAARAGVIVNTGELRTASRGGEHDHAQRLTVWKGANP